MHAFMTIISRAVKVGQNSWANPVHHEFKPGWIKIFLQILIWVNFWPSPPRTQLTELNQ